MNHINHHFGILTDADKERNRNDSGAYRARSMAFRLPAIIDYLTEFSATYRQDVGGDEFDQAADILVNALVKAKARGAR